MPSQNWLSAQIIGAVLGQKYVNEIYFLDQEPGRTLLELATLIKNNWTQAMRPLQSSRLVYNSIFLKRVGGGTEGYLLQHEGLACTGHVSMMPLQCSVVWTLRTGFAGQSNRGRTYVGCVPFEHYGFDGLWNSGMTSGHASVIAYLLSVFSGGLPNRLSWVVYSRKLDQVRAITSVQTRTVPYTQRRRNFNYGA